MELLCSHAKAETTITVEKKVLFKKKKSKIPYRMKQT